MSRSAFAFACPISLHRAYVANVIDDPHPPRTPDFDYAEYFETLGAHGLSLTQAFVGSYVEPDDDCDPTGTMTSTSFWASFHAFSNVTTRCGAIFLVPMLVGS